MSSVKAPGAWRGPRGRGAEGTSSASRGRARSRAHPLPRPESDQGPAPRNSCLGPSFLTRKMGRTVVPTA